MFHKITPAIININLQTGGGILRKKKEPIGEKARRVGEMLDLPAQMLPGFCHLEFWQNRNAVIEGVKGVLSYSDSEIQLNLASLVVTVKGADLSISSYQAEQLSMAGTIAEVHFRN